MDNGREENLTADQAAMLAAYGTSLGPAFSIGTETTSDQAAMLAAYGSCAVKVEETSIKEEPTDDASMQVIMKEEPDKQQISEREPEGWQPIMEEVYRGDGTPPVIITPCSTPQLNEEADRDPYDPSQSLSSFASANGAPNEPSITAGGNPYIAGGLNDLLKGHQSVVQRESSSQMGVYIDVCEDPNHKGFIFDKTASEDSRDVISKETTKTFACKHCDKVFTASSSLSRHEQAKHLVATTTVTEQEFKCNICGRICKNQSGLTKHMLKHSRAIAASAQPPPSFTSNTTSKNVSDTSKLLTAATAKTSHGQGNASSEENSPKKMKLVTKESGEDEKKPTCSVCSKAFSKRASLYHHLTQAHGVLRAHFFKCECKQVFINQNQLRKHRAVDGNCPIRFNSQGDEHEQLECGTCGKKFQFFATYRRHMTMTRHGTSSGNKTHSSKSPSKSPQSQSKAIAISSTSSDDVDKAAKAKNSSAKRSPQHTDIVAGTKCLACDKDFKMHSLLRRHLRMKHSTQDQGLRCSHCLQHFSSNFRLQYHVQHDCAVKNLNSTDEEISEITNIETPQPEFTEIRKGKMTPPGPSDRKDDKRRSPGTGKKQDDKVRSPGTSERKDTKRFSPKTNERKHDKRPSPGTSEMKRHKRPSSRTSETKRRKTLSPESRERKEDETPTNNFYSQNNSPKTNTEKAIVSKEEKRKVKKAVKKQLVSPLGGSDSETPTCGECGSSFKLAALMARHMIRHGARATSCPACNQCGKLFASATSLQHHKRYTCEPNFELLKKPKETKKTSDEEWRCGEAGCARSFPTHQSAVSHVRRLHKVSHVWKCRPCHTVFTSYRLLEQHHRATHQTSASSTDEYSDHEPPVVTSKPDLTMVQWPGRKGEFKQLVGEDGFTCTVCCVRTAGGEELKAHLWALHGIGQPLKCHRCASVFKWQRTLKAHESKCTGKGAKKAFTKELDQLLTDASLSLTSSKPVSGDSDTTVASALGVSTFTQRRAAQASLQRIRALATDISPKAPSRRASSSRERDPAFKPHITRASSSSPMLIKDDDEDEFDSSKLAQLAKGANLLKLALKARTSLKRLTSSELRLYGVTLSEPRTVHSKPGPASKKRRLLSPQIRDVDRPPVQQERFTRSTSKSPGWSPGTSVTRSQSKESISPRKYKPGPRSKRRIPTPNRLSIDSSSPAYSPPMSPKSPSPPPPEQKQDGTKNKDKIVRTKTLSASDKQDKSNKAVVAGDTEDEVLELSDSGDDDERTSSTKAETVSVNGNDIRLTLPIKILLSSNRCRNPEVRTLYLGSKSKSSSHSNWLRVIGKQSKKFMYQCFYCTRASDQPLDVASHMNTRHKDRVVEQSKPSHMDQLSWFLCCRHCDYIGMTQEVLWEHFRDAHKVKDILMSSDTVSTSFQMMGPNRHFRCPLPSCDFRNPAHNADNMVEHMLSDHRGLNEYNQPGFIMLETTRQGSGSRWDQLFLCKLCQFWTFNLSLMHQHAIKHHVKKVLLFVCNECSEQFVHSGALPGHMKKHGLQKVVVTVTVLDEHGREDSSLAENRKTRKSRDSGGSASIESDTESSAGTTSTSSSLSSSPVPGTSKSKPGSSLEEKTVNAGRGKSRSADGKQRVFRSSAAAAQKKKITTSPKVKSTSPRTRSTRQSERETQEDVTVISLDSSEDEEPPTEPAEKEAPPTKETTQKIVQEETIVLSDSDDDIKVTSCVVKSGSSGSETRGSPAIERGTYTINDGKLLLQPGARTPATAVPGLTPNPYATPQPPQGVDQKPMLQNPHMYIQQQNMQQSVPSMSSVQHTPGMYAGVPPTAQIIKGPVPHASNMQAHAGTNTPYGHQTPVQTGVFIQGTYNPTSYNNTSVGTSANSNAITSDPVLSSYQRSSNVKINVVRPQNMQPSSGVFTSSAGNQSYPSNFVYSQQPNQTPPHNYGYVHVQQSSMQPTVYGTPPHSNYAARNPGKDINIAQQGASTSYAQPERNSSNNQSEEAMTISLTCDDSPPPPS